MTSLAGPTRILAAVDFGEASASAVALAGMVAARFDAALTVLHAETMEVPPYFTEEQIESLRAERLEARARATDYVRRFAASHTAAPFEPVVRDGPADDAIVAQAQGADLVVMGTHGRRGPSRWWLGSVAEAVVRRVRVPVLVTRGLAKADVERLTRTGGVVIATAGAPAAERWSTLLAAAIGGRVVPEPDVASCARERLGSADLVVVPVPPPGSLAEDIVAGVLKSCSRPVLLVPEGEADTGGGAQAPAGTRRSGVGPGHDTKGERQ